MRGHLVRQQWEPDPSLRAPRKHLRPCSYDAFVPDPIAGLEISISGEVAALVSSAEAAVASLNATAQPSLNPLARLLLRTESIASSKVDGMQLDVHRLARAEATHDAGRAIGREAAEVLANIDAMQFAMELSVESATLEAQDLLAIHEVLLERAPGGGDPGHFRNEQNWIGGNDYNPCGADFVPPPPHEVEGLIEDLCIFCDEDALPPLVQAAIAHAQFETIHPFDGGNGRTGRALVQVLLRRSGLAPVFVPPISVVFAADKPRYIRGLTLFRDAEIDAWLEIFATATARAATLATDHQARVSNLQEKWRAQLRTSSAPRSDAAAWAVIDELPAHPIISVPVAVAVTGRTKPAINNAMRQLVEAGVLIPMTELRRNRAWEADGLLDLIAELQSGA
jgi:Fic family protein